MKSPLHILYLEDDPRDAELVQETLAGDGIASHITRVDTEADFIESLYQGGVDLIFADYTLPSFDGISALKVAKRDWPDVPFIFVSGTLGEEVAIEALKIGATDYVFKTRLSRIAPSVRRALREADERTGLSQAEEALRRSETYLAEAQKLSHTGSFGWDVFSGEIYWSLETFRIFGYEPADKATIEMIVQRSHPDDRPALRQLVERVSEEMTAFDFEHRLLMPDGSVKHVRVVGNPSKDELGRPEFAGAVTDITELKRGESLLRESEQRFRAIFNEAGTGIAVVDLAGGRPIESNRALQKMLGCSREELSRLETYDELTCEEDREADAALFREIRDGNLETLRQEKHLILRDGRSVWANVIFTLLRDTEGRPKYLVAIHEDVTERKQAEEKLKRSEADLLEAQRISHAGSWRHNLSSGIVTISPEVHRIFGIGPEEDATKADFFFRRIHEEDRPAEAQNYERANLAKTGFESDYRIVLPNGSIKHIHNIGHPVLSGTGELVAYVGTTMDVTAARIAEDKIRQSERELRQIVDTVAQLVIFLSPDGQGIHANRFTLDYTGLSLEEVKAENFRERIFHPDDVERLREERKMALLRGVPFENEQRARRKDGQYRWFYFRYNALLDEQGRPIRWYAAGIDIEDRKQAEEKIRKENLALREEIDHSLMFEEIVGGSPALQSVLARVAKVAPTDSTVLVTGETGTGKELFARAIHKRSLRSTRAFVSINCAATPATLIASELFGHEKGAFTGALQRRLGRFEHAEGGTIFLDEIGELPAETQITLLRVLQEREFDRVGGSHPIRADVRVIAATNRNLESAIDVGAFRKDLFYRLNVFPIEIPPLRERKEDIPTLIEYFVQRYSRKIGKKIRTIEKKTLELLESYPWPGNIRELQNIIERSVIFCETDHFSVDPSWLSFESSAPTLADVPAAKMTPAQEREVIEKALAATEGRISGHLGAAARLGMPASTLESKIRSLRINKFRFKRI